MSSEKNFFQELSEEMSSIRVIDTHEHLMPENVRVKSKNDFIGIITSHYLSSDLRSAGMSMEYMQVLKDSESDPDTKIKLFIPFWEKVANTAYSRVIKIAAKGLYGIDEINESTLTELNERVEKANKPGLYRKILMDTLNIRYCIWDNFYEADGDDLFKLAVRLDDIVGVTDKESIARLERKHNRSIEKPSALEEIFEICITSLKSKRITAIKCGLAYERTLEFEPVSQIEAELAMDKIMRGRFLESDAKILQDYLMYSLAEKACWHNLPIQIHTGLQEGNGNNIRNSNPALLSSLIERNPNTRFDLFHGGYPFGGEIAVLAKMFPNVYLDLCWTHAISPAYTRRYLDEWLDTVPVNKIFGFGGDYIFIEGVYGHLAIAKENIARVLAAKVHDGVFTMSEAKRYARMILHDNAAKFFGLPN